MDYELVFMPVGEKSSPGDSIYCRHRDGAGREFITVIDGGDLTAGKSLVLELSRDYIANTNIADVISTHPDQDHLSGIRVILENFKVHNLWMHRP